MIPQFICFAILSGGAAGVEESPSEDHNMQTIMLDGSMYDDSKGVHLALKQMLGLPAYYGLNADALNDCLGEMTESVNLWIFDPGKDEAAVAISRVAAVIRDNGGEVKELQAL